MDPIRSTFPFVTPADPPIAVLVPTGIVVDPIGAKIGRP